MKEFFLYAGTAAALIMGYSLAFGPICWGSYLCGAVVMTTINFLSFVRS